MALCGGSRDPSTIVDTGDRISPMRFADQLLDAIDRYRAPCVVALDPVFKNLPDELTRPHGPDPDFAAQLQCIEAFADRVIECIAGAVPAVKINSAYFEAYGAGGTACYHKLLHRAKAAGLVTIGDVKRGDVGHTAEMYARAHLSDAALADAQTQAMPDAVTISGYFGSDGASPFIDIAKQEGRGIFVLVRTSNKSAAAIQDVVTGDGRKVHEIVAGEVARWASESDTTGRHGYSSVGAVVATRNAADAARLRQAMPQSIFLVPGYGAQGGRAEDFLPYFDASGKGAIIAAGRSVIFAYADAAMRAGCSGDWQACVRKSCQDFVADIRRAARL